jgi:hypothetical protein
LGIQLPRAHRPGGWPRQQLRCGQGSASVCYIEAQQGRTTISTPLSFRLLKVTIDGGTGGSFRNGKSVTVKVGNFPAGDKIVVEICPADNSGDRCGEGAGGKTDSNGSITFDDYRLNCVQIDASGLCPLLALDQSYRKGSGVGVSIDFETYGRLP